MNADRNIEHISGKVTLHPASKRSVKIKDQLAITTKSRIELIAIHEILHLRAESNYTHIYLIDGSHLMTSLTLKCFDALLSMPEFMRIHQSHIIQTRHLRSFDMSAGVVHLQGDLILPVSRARKYFLMQYLKTLMISH